jgi:inner membrane protein
MEFEQLIAFFNQLGFWTWWIAAGLLIILEALAPGAVFLWLGISGAVVGLIAWLNPGMSWEIQTSLFAILSVASIVLWRRFFKTQPSDTDHPSLNERSRELIGKELSLLEAIRNGQGRVRIGDSVWLVEGPDLPEGAKVVVQGIRGSTLTVQPAQIQAGS